MVAVADGAFPQQFLFEELAAAEGFIMAFPQAEHVEPNEGGWQLNSRADWMQDINYVSAVIDDIGSGYSIDQRRVYGIGYSLGSMFIYELACHMTDRFAALASYAGTMPVNPDYCEQVRPIPLLHVHGKNDGIVAYGSEWEWKAWDSVGTMRDIPGLISSWASKYNCAEVTDTMTENISNTLHMAVARGTAGWNSMVWVARTTTGPRPSIKFQCTRCCGTSSGISARLIENLNPLKVWRPLFDKRCHTFLEVAALEAFIHPDRRFIHRFAQFTIQVLVDLALHHHD